MRPARRADPPHRPDHSKKPRSPLQSPSPDRLPDPSAGAQSFTHSDTDISLPPIASYPTPQLGSKMTKARTAATVWSGGEAIIRFQPGPVFSNLTNDYWSPTNWMALHGSDTDLGGSGALIVDVPGATPSKLVVSLGKDGNAYLLNRTNLGGVSVPLAKAHISSSTIIQAAATYQAAQGTYVVCCGDSTSLIAFRITPTSPPAISGVWTNSENGRGSPFVTSTDGTNNAIVWGIGSEGNQRLQGFNGDTGAIVFNGGGAIELMAGTRRFN